MLKVPSVYGGRIIKDLATKIGVQYYKFFRSLSLIIFGNTFFPYNRRYFLQQNGIMNKNQTLVSLAIFTALYSQQSMADLRDQCLMGVPHFTGEVVQGDLKYLTRLY